MLTATDKKKLAREARKLAMECVEGMAPKLIAGMFYYNGECCVLGEVGRRAGFNFKSTGGLGGE